MPAARHRRQHAVLDLGHEPESFEHQRRVKLHEARAGLDLLDRRLAGVYSTNANKRERALRAHIGFRQHPRRQGKQRPAGQAALLDRLLALLQARRTRQCRVAHDHAVDLARPCHADDVVELGEREIGRDLDQKRRRPRALAHAVAHVDHARQKIIEAGCALQIAQAGRIRRGDIHRDVACDRRKDFDQSDIIGHAIGTVAIGADIDPDNPALVHALGEARQDRILAVIVEAEPVDHRLIGIEPENARARIALLRARRDGADLDKAEPKAKQRIRHLAVLVEAGRDADGIGKIQSEHPGRKFRIVGARPRQRRQFQAGQGEPVRVFRVQRLQQGPGQTVEEAEQA